MSTTPAVKKRKKPVKHEGERYRIALVKGEGEAKAVLSLSLSPSATGYTLRARSKSPQTGARVVVEFFAEAVSGDSFLAGKTRVAELVKSALAKGWTEKKVARDIEDLL